MAIYKNIYEKFINKQKQLAILIDPDKTNISDAKSIAIECEKLKIDYIFVGSSLLLNGDIDSCIKSIKSNCNIPVIIFPGNKMQISSHANGILFLSLISGRNAENLIGNHVIAAPQIKKAELEVIPTGYMLIDCGKTTSVNYMSNTSPIPSDKNDIAICTAIAGEMLGLKMVYLEGGSGASKPIPKEMIKQVSKNITVPMIVGGGIKETSQASDIWNAGADLLVVGNALEKNPEFIKSLVNKRNEINHK